MKGRLVKILSTFYSLDGIHIEKKKKKEVTFGILESHTRRTEENKRPSRKEDKARSSFWKSLIIIHILTREEAQKTKEEAHIGVFGSLFHCFLYWVLISFWIDLNSMCD